MIFRCKKCSGVYSTTKTLEKEITSPKFNIAPEKLPLNGNVVFQPPFFRGYVKLREGIPKVLVHIWKKCQPSRSLKKKYNHLNGVTSHSYQNLRGNALIEFVT